MKTPITEKKFVAVADDIDIIQSDSVSGMKLEKAIKTLNLLKNAKKPSVKDRLNSALKAKPTSI